MTEFEQVIISELVAIKSILQDIYVESSNTFQDVHGLSDYFLYEVHPCPNKYDIFDPRCQHCKWGDTCVRDYAYENGDYIVKEVVVEKKELKK